MCGFYDDEQKIRKGDKATFNGKNITIQKATHIKENRTMDIVYIDENQKENSANIPYQTSGYGFELKTRGLK